MLPLLTTPFLIRTIGLENFGTVEFIKAFCFYFIIFIEYGFNYSAMQQISIEQNKQDKAEQIISSVYLIKAGFLLVSLGALWLLAQYVAAISNVKDFLYFYLPVVVCQVMFPTFVLQGVEKLKWAALINAFGKFVFLFFLFAWVRGPEDAFYYPLFLSIAEIFRLVIGLFFMLAVLRFRFVWPGKEQILFQLKNGFAIFVSIISISVYSRLPTVFLGFFCGSTSVGIYNSSIRIIRSTLGLIDPLTQALFPLAARKIHKNRIEGIHYVFRLLKITAFAAIVLGSGYFLFARQILLIMTGEALPEALRILRLHSFLPFIVLLSNIVGIQLLVPLGKKKEYSLTMLATAFIAFFLLSVSAPFLQAYVAARAILVSEVFATVLMFCFYYKTVSAPLVSSSV